MKICCYEDMLFREDLLRLICSKRISNEEKFQFDDKFVEEIR